MSYRLINSNEIAIKYPEVNEMDCIYVDLPNGLDNEYHHIDAEPNTAIETIDWYHQNADGEMVLGANSNQQAWFKADDVFKALKAESTKHYNTESYKMTVTDFPPVEYALIKHGRWIASKDGHGCECSQCGTTYRWSEADTMRYCKICGARMDNGPTDDAKNELLAKIVNNSPICRNCDIYRDGWNVCFMASECLTNGFKFCKRRKEEDG